MTQAEKNSIYLCLKCGISTFTTKFNENISIGKCSEETLERLTISSFLLDVLCGFNPECTTTYRYSIDLTKVTVEGGGDSTLQADLEVDGTVIATYTGNGTADEIIESWDTQINNNSETTGFVSSFVTNVLTLWTCNTVPPSTAPVVTETDLGVGSLLLSYEANVLANTTVDNMYNCITEDQACNIIAKIKYFVTDCGC